jgi:phosphonate transport system substrate-binding protein
LAQSGSVDGYVWEVIAEIEPELARQTQVIARSDWLGFPPVACPVRMRDSVETLALRHALLGMRGDPEGTRLLSELRLDGFTGSEPSLFDGIAANVARVQRFG